MTRPKHNPSKLRARMVRKKELLARARGRGHTIKIGGTGETGVSKHAQLAKAAAMVNAGTLVPPQERAPAPPQHRERLSARIEARQARRAAELAKISATINGAPAEVIQSITLGGRTAYIVAAPETEDDLDAALGELATHRAAELASGDAVAYPASIGNAIFANIHPLRAIRDWRGHTQAELGALVESSGEYIGQLERGHRSLTAAMAAKLAEALDVPAEDLDPATWLDDED